MPGDMKLGRQHSHRVAGPAPIRRSDADADAVRAAALSSTPFGAPVDPDVAITTAVIGRNAARPARR